MHLYSAIKSASKGLTKIGELPAVSKTVGVFRGLKSAAGDLIPVTPQGKILFQTSAIALAAIVSSAITPGGTFVSSYVAYDVEYMESYSMPSDILVADEYGYLVKINPQTDDSNRVGMTDYAVHTVESGETLSLIASRYGVNVDTIMWENGIGNANSIKSGQKLMVPPVDGISYEVKKGDTLENISEEYEISTDSIIAQNALGAATVVKGQQIFLPGAEPLAPPPQIIASNPTIIRNDNTVRDGGTTRTVDFSSIPANNTAPVGAKPFIFPTRGKITQGYHGGHLALDIADRSKPPIWAAGGGTVSSVSTGTYGGGYGNHVYIDHGNGLVSHYAHLDTVNVAPGQWVNQGDVIGIMGNTGRVYGATGIHLHFEVIDNGVKKNPGYYY